MKRFAKPREARHGNVLETVRSVRATCVGRRAFDGWAAATHKGVRSLVGIETKANVRIRIFVGSRLDLNPLSNSFALRKQLPGRNKSRVTLAERTASRF